MAETLTAPLTPGAHGARWLAEELLLGGLAEVRRDILPDVPEQLRQPTYGLNITGWQDAGRLAQIGTPQAEAHHPNMTKAQRREARAASAHTLAYVGFAALAAANSRNHENTISFLDNAHTVLVRGAKPQPGGADDPRQAAILEYGQRLHQRLGFNEQSDWSWAIDRLFAELNSHLFEQLAESAPGNRDPQRLLDLAIKTGGTCAQMAAIVAAKPARMEDFVPNLRAANAFGAVGFLENHLLGIKVGNMETYASARIRQEAGPDGKLTLAGVRRGMRAAHEMRKKAEARLFHEAMSAFPPGRERDIVGSQLSFVRPVYLIQRAVGWLSGRNRRIAKQLSR